MMETLREILKEMLEINEEIKYGNISGGALVSLHKVIREMWWLPSGPRGNC